MFFLLPFLGGDDRLRVSHLPHQRALVFHLARRPGWVWHTEGNTQWKTSLPGNAREAARQWCLPVVVVQTASWKAVILSKKMLGKAKSKSKEGWKESWSTKNLLWAE